MKRWAPYAGPTVLVLAVVVFSLSTTSAYRYNLVTLAGIYAIATIGLTVLFGGAGQISLGHAGFIGIGAWLGGVLMTDHGWTFLAAAAASVLAATIIGIILGYAALRITGHYLALATVAFGLLFVEVMHTAFPQGLYGVPPLDLVFWEASSSRSLFLVVWGFAILVYVMSKSLVHSRFGRSLAAMRDDPVAAAACGIQISRTKIAVFAYSAALGGFAGALFAPYQASVTDVSFGFFLSVNLLIMAVIGGLGSPFGALVGALFLVIVPEFGRDYERIRLLAYGVVLVVTVVAFPGGLTALGRMVVRHQPNREPRDRPVEPGNARLSAKEG